MAIQKDEAFVLKRIPLRESSLLVTLFCREAGKIKAVAKGIRKEKKPLTIRFEPFTCLSVVYYEKLKSDIHLLSQVSISETYAFLRNRLDWFSYGSYLTELVDHLFNTHDPHPEVFDLLGEAFRQFSHASAASVARAFEVKLLSLIGWLPELTQCASCGTKEMEQLYFSARQGGILCSKCDQKESKSLPISKKAVQTLLFYLQNPLAKASQLQLDLQTERELERVGEQFLQFRLEYPLQSRRFLSEMRGFLKN